MALDKISMFEEIVPKKGFVYDKDNSVFVLCKPKIMPLKSVTLEKMEKMQTKIKDAKKPATASGFNN